ncbi:MAG: glycosyltransferase [Opitutales bacterium]|nr:glycosyltransferase [Opitutales bacterium]
MRTKIEGNGITEVDGSEEKPKVLFEGGFSKPKDGSTGGQVFACSSLVSSDLKDHVQWILLDTTMDSLPPPPFIHRLRKAIFRTHKFLWLLAVRRPDVVIIFTASGASFVEKGMHVFLARCMRTPVLLSPRSGKDQRMMERSVFFRWYIPFVLRQCSLVICQSPEWASFYQRTGKLQASRIKVIPNWIQVPSSFTGEGKSIDGSVKVVYMGWMEKHKGIYELLEVISDNQSRWRHVQFFFAGNGSEFSAFCERVENLSLDPIVKCLGWVYGEGKERLLASADCFVSFSYAEGMPNALLEAAAAGCACVATDVGASDTILPDKSFGLLVPAGDKVALEKALDSMIFNRELRIQTGSRARAYVRKNFSVDNAVNRFHEAIMSQVK